MDAIKTILKLAGGLLAGMLAGFLLAGIGVVCFTDETPAEFINSMLSMKFGESMIAAAVGIAAFAVSLFVLITAHESGHLVCGLMTGYKFVSFRIFSLTFIKTDGRVRVKRFAIAGTGGQCLLTPPDLPIDRIPTAWYNFGGVLADIILVAAVLPLLWSGGHPLLMESVVIFILTGALLIVLNGIPMKISGAGNDAYNMIALRKNLLSKRGLVDSLRCNALIQNGTRPKEMPAEWFVVPEGIDYSNQLETAIPLMAAARLVDEMRFLDALAAYENVYSHKKQIIGLYVKEIECELVFLRLVCGDVDSARQLLNPALRKYIEAYRTMMSSKQRVLFAIYLIIDRDSAKAIDTFNNLSEHRGDYLLQGEVNSDLAIMESLLKDLSEETK